MQKSVRYNEGHALYLSVIARKEGTKRGFLSKKTTENGRWAEKFFALYQNVLFYFENDQSARPSGIYLLEGCTCERAPAPKASGIGRDPPERQQATNMTQIDVLLLPGSAAGADKVSEGRSFASEPLNQQKGLNSSYKLCDSVSNIERNV